VAPVFPEVASIRGTGGLAICRRRGIVTPTYDSIKTDSGERNHLEHRTTGLARGHGACRKAASASNI
jgi:hypothetical protein